MERSKHPRRKASFAALILLPLALGGCTQHAAPTGEQVQQQANQDAQRAGQELGQAKDEAKQAVDKARAATAGVVDSAKQGWHEGSAHADRVDLNHASAATLETLPGVDARLAHAIVRSRPYSQPEDLVSRGVLTADEWQQLQGRVTANP